MDAGLPRVEFETLGRIASAVGKTRANRAPSDKNQPISAFQPQFHQPGRLKTDRLLGKHWFIPHPSGQARRSNCQCFEKLREELLCVALRLSPRAARMTASARRSGFSREWRAATQAATFSRLKPLLRDTGFMSGFVQCIPGGRLAQAVLVAAAFRASRSRWQGARSRCARCSGSCECICSAKASRRGSCAALRVSIRARAASRGLLVPAT